MSEYHLSNGTVITDEDLEKEALEYEKGEWDGHLVSARSGRPRISDEALVTVPVKFPVSMVAAIDRKTNNRSDYIRKAVAATLL